MAGSGRMAGVEVVVVGGGISGTAAAYELARAGEVMASASARSRASWCASW